MARLRTLKPGFFLNEELAQVPPIGRLLFAGLWCLADREGRLEDRPARIRVEILGYDECDINELLGDLASRGFIHRYEVDGRPYIQVVNFNKHQSPHMKEAPSTIPAPDEHGLSTVLSAQSLGSGVLGSGVLGSGELGSGELGSGELGSGEPRKSAARPPEPVTDQFLDELAAEFGPQMGGAHRARDAIAAALNHTAQKKAIDKRLYLRRWLQRDVDSPRERSNGAHRDRSRAAAEPGADPDLVALGKYR